MAWLTYSAAGVGRRSSRPGRSAPNASERGKENVGQNTQDYSDGQDWAAAQQLWYTESDCAATCLAAFRVSLSHGPHVI
jgi:hypothetical protein